MYSDSVVERATELCFFDDQVTAPPANVNTNPETDSRPSSPPQFASLQAFNLMPRFPLYVIPSSIVPLIYRSPCFAAFSCAFVGFCENCETCCIDCARSGRVASIAYIRLPTMLWYSF